MEKLDELIKKFQDAKESLNKNVNESYSGEQNVVKTDGSGDMAGAMAMSEHMTVNKGGQWELHKAGPEAPHKGSSAFNMDHVREVSEMKDHAAAKAHAHKIVDASTANAGNKAKLKQMINSSRNTAHLAQGMSNHILAHPSENLKVGR